MAPLGTLVRWSLVCIVVVAPHAASAPIYFTPCEAPPMYLAGDAESLEDCGARAGDPLGDAWAGPPADEYIDPLTGVVYRLEDGELRAIGASPGWTGYVRLNTYRNGEYSGDPIADFGCTADAVLYRDFCGACVGDYCLHWRVAITGSHEIAIHHERFDNPTDTCTPDSYYHEWTVTYPAEGGIVTQRDDVEHEMAPWGGCGVGHYFATLYIDGVKYASDHTAYGPPYPPYPCVHDTIYFLQYGYLYLDSCVACWRDVACKLDDVLRGPQL